MYTTQLCPPIIFTLHHLYYSHSQIQVTSKIIHQTKDSLPLEGTHGYTVGGISICRGTLRSVSPHTVLEGSIEL